ncbi:MAG: UDP-N-acetylglucosamine diphosphorylase / glucose-phosphate thymidylyltransferase [Gaiellaceae bacterium]|jgi:CTP:molybdopterin cytidylyltransferase MocA|nr:UDP-N-acetylglucosamine diphosphorylase / glucose-phosphate thymidylyltransferase [Gaiellaceae bacterium]
MAAGEGTRLRPITEHWPKPVLPIDGRPVVVTLVHGLAAAGCDRIVVVTGHLADQVEALLEPLPYDLRFVRQPPGQGSADAVLRAQATPPYLVVAADTLFAEGDLARFARVGAGLDGAIALHGEERPPLWLVGPRVHGFLDPLPGKAPYELQDVFRNAKDAGAEVSAIQVGRTRDLTKPADLVRENFPYLRRRLDGGEQTT